MASQPLDTLLNVVAASQSSTRSRNAEPSARGGGDVGPFGPVLNRALHTDEGTATRRRETEFDDDGNLTDVAADRDDAADGAPEETAADEEATSSDPELVEIKEDVDAAEISAEGAEAAAAAAAAAANGAIPVVVDDATAVAPDEQQSAAAESAPRAPDGESGDETPQELSAASMASPTDDHSAKPAEANTARLVDDVSRAEGAQRLPDADAAESAAAAETTQKPALAGSETTGNEGSLPSQGNVQAELAADPATLTGDEPDARPSEDKLVNDAQAVASDPIVEIAPTTLDADVEATAASGASVEITAAPSATAGGSDSPAAARGAAALSRLPTARSAAAGDSRSEGDGIGHVDRGRFLGRVEGAIRTAQQRDGRVQVRLSPPELGTLRIELTIQNGVMSARLEAETPATRNLLLDNLPALRDRLAQQDIRVERFDVDLQRDGGGSSGQQQAQDRPTGDPSWRQDDQRRQRAMKPGEILRGPRTVNVRTTADGALDVRV